MGNAYVTHKHEASTTHYDLRLEIDGKLASWAVPKGPSLDPSQKRLAIPTDDHPLDYKDYEGTIPEGQYGAGTVMAWDRGTHSDLEGSREEGHLTFTLHGEKLKGRWALHRFRGKNWLLIKKDDEHADRNKDILKQDRSAKTGKTMEEIRGT